MAAPLLVVCMTSSFLIYKWCMYDFYSLYNHLSIVCIEFSVDSRCTAYVNVWRLLHNRCVKYIVSDTNSFLEVSCHPSAKVACKQEDTRLSKQGSLYSAQKWADLGSQKSHQTKPTNESLGFCQQMWWDSNLRRPL